MDEQYMQLAFVKGDESALECIIDSYKHPLFRYSITLSFACQAKFVQELAGVPDAPVVRLGYNK